MGIAAAAVGVIKFLVPSLGLEWQLLLFAVLSILTAIVEGRGKIKVGDGVWMASGPDAPAGAHVRVIGQEGVILQVETV
eukprot:gene20070-23860_t